jgi:hypothetical protein
VREYLIDLAPILMLLLGWFLGLLAPPITERIRRRYREKDLIQAVADELLGLEYTMAFVALKIRLRNAEVTDEFLDSLLPIVEDYKGPDRDEKVLDALTEMRKLPEHQRAAVHRQQRQPQAGLGLQQYGLPLLATQVADLAICPIGFQRAVLNVRYHLDLFNCSAAYLQSQFDKTFMDLTEENHTAILKNLESASWACGPPNQMKMSFGPA